MSVRLARADDGWAALVEAPPECRLTAEWRGEQGETWQRKVLPPLRELVSDEDILWYA
jgi:hypothetical protein